MFIPRAARLKAKELIVAPEGVIRERLAQDPKPTDLIISDLEGELFFGAGPELDALFDTLWNRVREDGVRFVILRVKRTRNPDMVCMERFEHFLREAQQAQVTVLVCGIRPDFATALDKLHFTRWFPAAQLLPEEDETFSATLRAVRIVYDRLGRKVRVPAADPAQAEAREKELYYLV
jgi:SulP family sulfate permease